VGPEPFFNFFMSFVFFLIMLKGDSESSVEVQSKEEEEGREARPERKTRILIILMKVGKKLIMNPNTYATFIGLIWASIHFRYAQCHISLAH